MIVKILVSILILILAGLAGYYLYEQEEPVCQVCQRPMFKATTCEIELKSGETVRVCCPRCGLYFQLGRNDVTHVQVADYDSGDLIDADHAFYVEGSSVHPCCEMGSGRKDQSGMQYQLSWDRCMPSLIGFDSEAGARLFSEKHGGSIKNYDELREEIERIEK